MLSFLLLLLLIIFIGSTVMFSQLTYSAAEDNGPLQPVLILSNSLSTNITIQVVDVNETAVGT